MIRSYGLKTGLDIGCGAGSPLTALRAIGFHSTGIDASPLSIEGARGRGAHDEYVLGDFRLQEFDRCFDVVLLSHVIEHFTRDEGIGILRKAEELTKRIIYVETPYGFLEQEDCDGNPFQRHLSGWFPHDFESRGYKVFGMGARGLTGPMGEPRWFPNSITRTIGRCTQWFFFRKPSLAATIAAIKVVDESGNICKV